MTLWGAGGKVTFVSVLIIGNKGGDYFKMNLFNLDIQTEFYSILIVTVIICVIIFVVNKKIKETDPLLKPRGIVSLAVMFVQMVEKLTSDNMSGQKVYRKYAPYIGLLMMYLLISNTIGLFGITSPTSNYSVTLTLTIITWLLVQNVAIGTQGWKGYFKGFFEPIIPFVIMNFFGLIAPLVSMSLRMFGNVLSGSVIMELLYTFTGWLSSMLPAIGIFNWFGVILAPALHMYFDLFSGFIQMFIFISLTSVYIGNELPEKEKEKNG